VSRRPWPVPAGLLLLALIPVLGGVIRLVTLAGGEITAENARFFAAPVPVVVHIVGASTFIVLGALQFVPAIRRRWPRWHRRAGRVLVVSGIAAALSGLWMTLFYPLPPTDGELLFVLRLIFGSSMAAFIGLGFAAARRRDFGRHRAWMIRGYAIGIATGTQALTSLVGILAFGPADELGKALALGAGWVINLAVAEWIIRRRPTRARAPLVAGAEAAS
jgi:uncharacterized membrane protein